MKETLTKAAAVLIGIIVTIFAFVFSIHQKQQQEFPLSQQIVKENMRTNISQKPRDKIISYTVEENDTLKNIAERFGISSDTILWENNLSSDQLQPGQTLRILPVTGVTHLVRVGDTIDSIAKKYKTTVKAITDYPFNNFKNPQTLTLIPGETLMIPGGRK